MLATLLLVEAWWEAWRATREALRNINCVVDRSVVGLCECEMFCSHSCTLFYLEVDKHLNTHRSSPLFFYVLPDVLHRVSSSRRFSFPPSRALFWSQRQLTKNYQRCCRRQIGNRYLTTCALETVADHLRAVTFVVGRGRDALHLYSPFHRPVVRPSQTSTDTNSCRSFDADLLPCLDYRTRALKMPRRGYFFFEHDFLEC